MKPRIALVAATCVVVLVASAAVPAEALAQRRVIRRAAPRTTVVVGGYYGRPYYYDSWYFGYPWYGGPGYYGARGYYNLSASMRLQVSPRDTEVFVDGYFAGTVDDFDGVFQRLDLEPGEHEVELYLPGHRSVTERVYLQPGKTSRLRHTMQPLAAGEAEPVKPSGRSTASSDDAITPVRRRPDPGGRRIGIEDPRDARDTRGGNSPVTAPGAYGGLSLRVQPGEATVTIDGEKWEGAGANDRLTVQLAPGRHVIDIQKDGYRQFTTEVVIKPGETSTLNVALTRN